MVAQVCAKHQGNHCFRFEFVPVGAKPLHIEIWFKIKHFHQENAFANVDRITLWFGFNVLNQRSRLLHSPILLAIGLSLEYETWPSVADITLLWLAGKIPLLQRIMGSSGRLEFTPSKKPLTVPLRSPYGRQMPAVRAVQGDCERVYQSAKYCICCDAYHFR